MSILAIGVWAWTEKNTLNNLYMLTNITLDPAFIFILIGELHLLQLYVLVVNHLSSFSGAITFIIGFTGCVGALRENTCLLAAYAIFLAILLLLEMTAGIMGFIFKNWVRMRLRCHVQESDRRICFQIKDQATSGFQAFIVHYRDDPDQQNLIDWIQEGWVRTRSLARTFARLLTIQSEILDIFLC